MISGCPHGAIAIAYKAITAYARAHPTFAAKRLVRTWHLWDEDGSLPIVDPIKLNTLPAVQAKIVGATTKKITSTRVPTAPDSGDYRVTLTIAWDVIVSGPNVLDLVSLGELLRDLFFPQDRIKAGLLARDFQAKHISDIRWNKPIVPGSDGYCQTFLVGSGSMEVDINMV